MPVRKRNLSVADDEGDGHQPSGCCSGLAQFTQETSITGLKHIGGASSGSIRRFFWLIVVLGALCGLAMQVCLSTTKFLERGTNTKLSYEMRTELDFPAVTFCNTNMFRFSRLSEYYGGFLTALLYGIDEVRAIFPQRGLSSVDGVTPEPVPFYPGKEGTTLYDFILGSAHLKQNMILLCEFNGQPCSAENFTTTVTNYGVCYTFTSSNQIDAPGQVQGLSLVLNQEEAEVIATPRENFGFKMLVHPHGDTPNLRNYGIGLVPGTSTSIRLDVTEMSILPYPFGDCGTKSLKYLSGGYTESKCHLECETDYVVSQCGCRYFHMPGNATYCLPHQLINCCFPAIRLFEKRRSSLCSCPNSCHETLYSPTISQTSFPSVGVALTLASGDKSQIPSSAFGETVIDLCVSSMQRIYVDLMRIMPDIISSQIDRSGNIFFGLYPNTSQILSDYLMADIFGNLQYSLFLNLSASVYKELDAEDVSHCRSCEGSIVHLNTILRVVEQYVDSNIYKTAIADALYDSGAYIGIGDGDYSSQYFQTFVDSVYQDFNMNSMFLDTANQLYVAVRAEIIGVGTQAYETTNIVELTADYMRKNFLQVDVFFGDLKVERIEEQEAYVLFQFICDLGGALGLFFGASLLSFVETVDFWFLRGVGSSKTSKIISVKGKNRIEVKPCYPDCLPNVQ